MPCILLVLHQLNSRAMGGFIKDIIVFFTRKAGGSQFILKGW